MILCLISCALVFLTSKALGSTKVCHSSYVNPIIGTTGVGYGSGQMSPAAQLPFGALRLGPDTTTGRQDIEFRHCSGYNHNDTTIRAFSHTRLVGAGLDDLGNFGVMPTSFDNKNEQNFFIKVKSWYSTMDKESESSSPAHYSVQLREPNVKAQMLAVSEYAGLHKYEWLSPQDDSRKGRGLVINVCHGATETLSDNADSCKEAQISFNQNNNYFNASLVFRGSLSGRESGLPMFITGVLSVVSVGMNTTDNNGSSRLKVPFVANRISCTDVNCKSNSNEAFVSSSTGVLYSHLNIHKTGALTIELSVAISFVSQDQAIVNFVDAFKISPLEMSRLSTLATSFSKHSEFSKASEASWCDALSTLTVKKATDTAGNPDNDFLTLFYSSLYRSLLSPTKYSEVGGSYRGQDNLIHNVAEQSSTEADFGVMSHQHFSDLSFWDTARTQNPWLFLTRKDVAIGMLRSIATMTKQRGLFPVWPLSSVETGCMIGFHGVATVAEAILAG